MLVKAFRLISDIEKGTIDGVGLQSALAASPSLAGQLAQLLNFPDYALRVFQSDAVNAAFAQSALGMNAYAECTYLMRKVGVTAGVRAFNILTAQSVGIAKLVTQNAGLEHTLFADMAALAASSSLTAVLNYSAPVAAVITNSALACQAIYDNSSGNQLTLANSSRSGAYVERLRLMDGLSASGLGGYSSIITWAGVATGGTAIIGSTRALTAICKSVAGRSAYAPGTQGYSEFTTAAAISKYWAGSIGVDPTTVSTMTDMALSDTMLNAIAANATAITHLCNQPLRLNELFSDSLAGHMLSSASDFFNAIKNNEQGVSKFIVNHSWLDIVPVTTYADVLSRIVSLVAYSSLEVMALAPGAMAAFFASPSTQDTLFADSGARAAISYNSQFYEAIKGNVQAINKYIGACAGLDTTLITSSTSTINTTAYWDAVAASSAAKMALMHSDTALNQLSGLGGSNAYNSLRAAAAYQVHSVTENGTTDVAISTMTGARYLCLGASRSASTSRDITLSALHYTSSISTTFTCSSSPSTSGAASKALVPLDPDFYARLNNTGNGTLYLGMLRCETDTTP